MNRSRLLTIVKVLETVPPKEFSIETWDCGTTACAIGWALRRDVMPGWGTRLTGFDGNRRVPRPPFGYENPDDDLYLSLAEWFGIYRKEAVYLFCPDEYASKSSPQEVIDRINKLMEEVS